VSIENNSFFEMIVHFFQSSSEISLSKVSSISSAFQFLFFDPPPNNLKISFCSNDKIADNPSEGCCIRTIHFALSLIFGVSVSMVERRLKKFFFEYFKVML
jgi:hypothetical protein